MRYTTVIDISEYPAVYRSTSARMIYLHLALKSGYHDNDRDLIDISIRRLAYDVGLTFGATRHALELLQREKLISKDGTKWRILKWTVIAPPTPRTKAAEKPSSADNALNDRWNKEVEEYRQRVYKAVRQCSKEQLQEWLQELEEGKRKAHFGASINPNQDNIAWLKRVIERL